MAKYLALFIPACANVLEEHVLLQMNGDQKTMETEGHGRSEYLVSMKQRIMSLAQEKVPADALPILDTIKTSLGSVMSTIANEKNMQVESHNILFGEFSAASDTYAADIAARSGLEAAASTAHGVHSDCRAQESIDHGESVTCDGEQVSEQGTFDSRVNAVESFASICTVDGVFRTDPVTTLDAYSGAVTAAIAQRVVLDAKVAECANFAGELADQTGVCNAAQTSLENAACAYALSTHTAWQVYDGLYTTAKNNFEAEFAVWEEQSGDREVQCQLVGTLVCYIEALENHDDAAPLGQAIAACDSANTDSCADVTFGHSATPAQDVMVPVPAAPCQAEFEYGEMPSGTTLGACTACVGL